MQSINLNILETFFEVYKLRSYTKASKTLKRTVASVVNHIQKLEEAQGKKLFSKKHMSLHPTEEANKIYHALYQHFHSLELALGSFHDEKEKSYLDIITSTGASMIWLLTELQKFSLKNDDQRFRIHTTEESHLTDPTLYDIIALPQKCDYPDYKMMHVASFHNQLYASEEYIEKFGIPQTPEELDNHRIISFYNRNENHRGDPDWALRIGRPVSNPREPFMIINNATGMGKAVALGIGIGPLTDDNPYIESSKLRLILPEFSGPISHLYINYNVLLANNTFIKEIEKKAL